MTPQDQLKQLLKRLPDCLNQDRHNLKKQLDRLRSEAQKNTLTFDRLLNIQQAIDISCALRDRRSALIPALNFPDLPVSEKKDDIAALISQHQVVIVCGETGSGKTTQLPKICMSIGRGAAGLIGHTQPRRIAARTVADRIAEELGQKIGQSVGYKVRFNDKTHADTLVKLMTDGILLAESQNDPYLSQYDTIIIDEAHERSLNIDFLLGYLKWLLPRRPDLKVVITSATIDPDSFSRHFNNAPIINVSGRTYPVEIRYRPIEQKDEEEEEADETSDDLQNAILDAVDELHRDMRGDVLIFLNGEREIRETTESLRKHHPAKCEILPLYSKLSVAEQERVFKPKGGLRIVLATNVAETSLTVPGIRCVIDTGHARISRYSHRSKIQRLPIEKISQASANQRSGRCGRVAEGICIRLYSAEDFQARPLFTEPEILRTNLSAVMLQMLSLKLGEIEDFPFIEPPDDKMIRDARGTLQEVNALDKSGKLTEIGKQLAQIPTDPKLARMLLAADKLQCLHEVSIIVSALSIQDPREKPADKLPQADQKHAVFKAEDSDFLTFVNIWKVFQEQQKHLSNSKLRKWCQENFLSYIRMREWQDIHAQIMQVVRGELKLKLNVGDAHYADIHRALLPGLLSNIGFKHEQFEYLGARNLKFFIFPGSGQYKARPKWIMAAEQVETSKVYARTVAKIEPEWIEECAQHLIKQSYYEPHWEKKAGRGAIYERTLLYGLTLSPKRKVPYEKVDPKAAREMFIRYALVNHEFHSNAPFFVANQQLLEEVGYIQHQARRVDLVEDEEWLYQFYEQKLPEGIVSGIALDQWRKTAERDKPKLLFLTKADLTRSQESQVNEWDFPDHKKVGNLSVALHYRFEPGHEEDGVTAIIPVHQLNQMQEQVFDWLVPGMLQEKVVALIKSLPKQIRKHFVPVPQTAEQCLEIEPDFKGSLYEWLANRLRKLTGESVPMNAWNGDEIPLHLKMNFRVVDEAGHILDFGRNLKQLQGKHTQKAGQSFDQIAAEELNYTGCIQWAFPNLPATYQFIQQGKTFLGYPAIIDEGDTVGVRILDTPDKAEQLHQQGLVRLFSLYLRKDCTYILKNLPRTPAVELAYQQLPKHPLLNDRPSQSYKEDCLNAVLQHVFVDQQSIRDQAAFEHILQANKGLLVSCANTLGKSLQTVMQQQALIVQQLKRLPPQAAIVKDIEEQLSHLIYHGFIRYTPYAQLQHFERYLKAILFRLEKMQEDQQKIQQVQKYWGKYWKQVGVKLKQGVVQPEQDNFRWMLEELRVSLYAQQLKTPYPVSAQRLEKAWNSVGR